MTDTTKSIYGTVTLEEFGNAAQTVCKYLDGLVNTCAIKDMLTEEYKKRLEPDMLVTGLVIIQINQAHGRLVDQLKKMESELKESLKNNAKGAEATEAPENLEDTEAPENLEDTENQTETK